MRAYDLSNARWRKSSYSDGDGGNIVEVRHDVPGGVPARASKNPTPPARRGPGAAGGAVGVGLQAAGLDDGRYQPRVLPGPRGPDGEQRGPEHTLLQGDTGGAPRVGIAGVVGGGADEDLPGGEVVGGGTDGQVTLAGGMATGGGTPGPDGLGEGGQTVGAGPNALPGTVDPGVVHVSQESLLGGLGQLGRGLGQSGVAQLGPLGRVSSRPGRQGRRRVGGRTQAPPYGRPSANSSHDRDEGSDQEHVVEVGNPGEPRDRARHLTPDPRQEDEHGPDGHAVALPDLPPVANAAEADGEEAEDDGIPEVGRRDIQLIVGAAR
ncbi:DUF397 domain-containing protein [Streptomyces gardneri]|uniref:DUF397 domain-containing protein n=1 Tax=Streptomyces gardneri TaxID=66892 RepID=UPI003675B283